MSTIYSYPTGVPVGPDGFVRSLPAAGALNEADLGESIAFQDDGSVLVSGMTVPPGAIELVIFLTGTKDGAVVTDVATFAISPGDTTRSLPSVQDFLGKCFGAADLRYYPCLRNAAGLGTPPRGNGKTFGAPVVVSPPVYTGGLTDLVLTAGEAFSRDWDNYFTGSTGYTVLGGLTGGVPANGSSSLDLYTVASLVAETATVTVVAENAHGTTPISFSVVVLGQATPPTLVTAIDDLIVPIQTSVDRDLATFFAGSDLIYSSTSSTAALAVASEGRLRNLAALSSPITPTTWPVQAESSLGSGRALANNPFSPTSGSATVTVAIPAHGLATNDLVGFTGAAPGSGLTIAGLHRVASTPTADTITIAAGANASASAPFGGASVVAHVPVRPLAVLGPNPLARASGQAYLRVTAAAHGLSVGDVVALRGLEQTLALILSALHAGAYVVTNIVDANTFDVIVSGTSHTNAGTGGGANVTLYKPRMPVALASDALAIAAGSPLVTVAAAGHGLKVGSRFALHGAAAAGGLNLNGNRLVESVLDADHFTFSAGANSSVTDADAGGPNIVLAYRGHTIPVPLAANPLKFTSGSTVVEVAYPGHGLTIGRAIYVSGAAAAAGLTIAGTYRVTSVLDADRFTIAAATTASSTVAAAGGNAVILHLPSPPALDHIQVGVTAEPAMSLVGHDLRFVGSVARFTDYRTPRFRVAREPIPMAGDPFKMTSGSAVVEVTLPNHGFEGDETIVVTDATAAGGITISGAYNVEQALDANRFTITHASAASSNATAGGGSNVLLSFPDQTLDLASSPFATTSGSSIVTLTAAAHGLGADRIVSFAGAASVGGLTLTGPYRIVSVTADTITFNAGSNASSTVAAGGGSGVVMTVRAHNQAILPPDNPISIANGSTSVSVSAPGHMLEVGRPIEVRGAPTNLGGLNINGARIVATASANSFTFDMPSAAGSAVSSQGGSGIQILPRWFDAHWSRSTPDSSGVIPDAQIETRIDETGNRIYEVYMTEAGRNGDPATQIASIALDANPFAITAGEKIVTVSKTAHGLSAGWVFTLSTSVSFGGIAIASTTPLTVVSATANSFTFEQAQTASSTVVAGGGTGVSLMPRRRDYSVWAATDGNQTLRLRYLKTSTALASGWSGPWTVPAVAADPGDPVGEAFWTAISPRHKKQYDGTSTIAPHPGNRGLQYQRIVAWNQATRNNANGEFGIIITGQDQDTGKMSFDYGRTWGPINIPGWYGSKPGGIHLNTDRNLLFAVLSKFGSQPAPTYSDFCGLYVGNLDGVVRKNLTYANGRQAFRGPMDGGTDSARRQQQCCAARPQNAAGTLTNAQMPLYAIDNDRNAVRDGPILNIDLWRSTDNGATWVSRSLPLADLADAEMGVMWVVCCPNGDLLFASPKGAFLLQAVNGVVPMDATLTKIFPASGNRNVSSIDYVDGSDTSVSGAILGVWIDTAGSGANNINTNTNTNNGFYVTGNVRTTAPGRQTGTGPLPNTYSIWSMGRSPLNHNLIAICGGDNDAMYSTDRGRSWAVLNPVVPYAESAYRMGFNPKKNGNGQTSFNFCPTAEKTCSATTQQTMTWTDNFPTWKPEKVGFFDGSAVRGFCWHYSDWKRFGLVMTDSTLNTTLDALKWLEESGYGTSHTAIKNAIIAAGGGTTSYGITGQSGLMGDNNRIVAGIHMSAASSKCCLVCFDGFSTAANTYGEYDEFTLITQASSAPTRAARSGWSLKEPGVVGFIGRFAITNFNAASASGIGKTDRGNEWLGQAMLDGDTLVTWWGDHSSGSNASNQRAQNIFRSTHDSGGNNQSAAWAVLKAGSTLANTRAWFDAIAPDPHHAGRQRVLYVPQSAPTEIWDVVKSGSTLTYTKLKDLKPLLRAWMEARLGSGCYIPDVEILNLEADPFMPGAFYAAFEGHGICNWWMTTDNGANWSPIQANCPATNVTCAGIHPLTGDKFGPNTLGTATLAPHQQVTGYPNVDEIAFTAGTAQIKPEQILTRGGVTATVQTVIVSSGSWSGGNAAGKIILKGRAGGNFTAGAATSAGGGVGTTGACTLSGAQTSIRGGVSLANQAFYDAIEWQPPAHIM